MLVRPSFVLGGRGMEIVYSTDALRDYFVRTAGEVIVEAGKPLLVDRFLDDAIEIDVDALYDGDELYIGGVMEHLEEAGIHSGDGELGSHAAAREPGPHGRRPGAHRDAGDRRPRRWRV